MNNFDTLYIGTIPASTTSIALVGLTYPTTGNYTVEALINGQWKISTLAGVQNAAISVPNAGTYPEDATVILRIKLATTTSTSNYITTAGGQLWFQWTNLPVV